MEFDTLEKGIQVLLVVCMRDMISCIRDVVPPLKRGDSDTLLSEDKGSLFIPMEPGTTVGVDHSAVHYSFGYLASRSMKS